MGTNKFSPSIILGVYALSFAATFANAVAWAGNADGGGGKSVVCRDDKNQITSATVLDLFEAENIIYEGRPAKIVRSNKSLDDQMSDIYKKLEQVGHYEGLALKFMMMSVRNALQILPEGKGVTPIDDVLNVIQPKGNCKLEQLANFMAPNLILVDGEIWKMLGNTDKAALIVHETIYWRERGLGAKDSRRSRRVTGQIFDQNTQFENVNDGVPKNALQCFAHGNGSQFYAFPIPGGMRLQFQSLGGQYIYSKKYFDVRNDDISFRFGPELVQGNEKVGESVSTTGMTESRIESGDVISIQSIHELINSPIVGSSPLKTMPLTITNLYLSGLSSWEPGRIYEKGLINCSLRTSLYPDGSSRN